MKQVKGVAVMLPMSLFALTSLSTAQALSLESVGPSDQPVIPEAYRDNPARLVIFDMKEVDPEVTVSGPLESRMQTFSSTYWQGKRQISGTKLKAENVTPEEGEQTTVTFNYRNVATYDGTPLDMKVEISGFVMQGKDLLAKDFELDYGHTIFNGYHTHASHVAVTFYDRDTGYPVRFNQSIPGFMTFNSLNPSPDPTWSGEGVRYDQASTAYVTDDTYLEAGAYDAIPGNDWVHGQVRSEAGFEDRPFASTFNKCAVTFLLDPSTATHTFDTTGTGANEGNRNGLWWSVSATPIWDQTTAGNKNPWRQRRRTPYETIRRFNPQLSPGETKEVQSGREGVEERTNITTVYPDGREETTMGDWRTITSSRNRIIEYGPSKNTTTEEGDIPYNTIRRPNPDLPNHTERVVQRGITGHKERTVSWLVNPETGQRVGDKSYGSWRITREKQDQIVEYGMPHPPKIYGVTQLVISNGQPLNLLHGIKAEDLEDGDLSNAIQISGQDRIDYTKDGSYPVEYTVTDKDGQTTRVVTNVFVRHYPIEKRLDNLKNGTKALGKTLDKLPDKVKAQVKNVLDPQILAIQKDLDALGKEDANQKVVWEDLLRRMGIIETNLNDLKAKDKEMEGGIHDFEVALHALGQTVDQIDQQVKDHEQRLQDLEARMRRVEQGITEASTRTDALAQREKALQSALQTVDHRYLPLLQAFQSSAGQQEEALKGLTTQREDVKKHALKDGDQIQAIKARLQSLLDALTLLEKRQATTEKDLYALLARCQAFEQDEARAQTQLTQLETRQQDLNERMKRAEATKDAQMDTLKAALVDNQQALNQLKQQFKALTEQTFAHASDLEQAQKALQQVFTGMQPVADRLADQSDQLDHLDQQVTDSEGQYQSLREGFARLLQVCEDTRDRIGRLSNRQANAKKELTGHLTAIESSAEEMTRQLTAAEHTQGSLKLSRATLERAKQALVTSGQKLKHLFAVMDALDHRGKAFDDRLDQLLNHQQTFADWLDASKGQPQQRQGGVLLLQGSSQSAQRTLSNGRQRPVINTQSSTSTIFVQSTRDHDPVDVPQESSQKEHSHTEGNQSLLSKADQSQATENSKASHTSAKTLPKTGQSLIAWLGSLPLMGGWLGMKGSYRRKERK